MLAGQKKIYNEKENWVCSGVLLNRWFILTAAHCKDIAVPKFNVRLGVHNIEGEKNSKSLPYVQNFEISSENFVIHEGFSQMEKNVENANNDIGLIKLPRQAKMNQLTQPACWRNQSYVSRQPVVVGWGKNDASQASSDKINGVYSNKQYKLEVIWN